MSEDVSELLRERGYRVTQARQAVWRVLVEAEDHLTAEELTQQVHATDPGINLASVYRSLSLFQQLELVRESRLGGDEASRWELAHPDEHFHLVCDRCGRVDHHEGTLVETIKDHLRRGHGFQPTAVELLVTGRCRTCAAAGTAPRRRNGGGRSAVGNTDR